MAITNYTDAEQYANTIVREAEQTAQRQREAAQRRQAALQAQADMYDQDYNKQVGIVNATNQVANANTGKAADDDLFSLQAQLQAANRQLNNSTGSSYGSVGLSKKAAIDRRNDQTAASIAKQYDTSMQQNQDNRDSSMNSLIAGRNNFYAGLANQQRDINDDYRNAIGDTAANMFSDLSGISDYDVRSQYFWDSGDRRYDDDGALAQDNDRNTWIWNGEGFSGQKSDTDWSSQIIDYNNPTKVADSIGQQNARKRQQNRSMQGFKSNTTSNWTFA